MGKVYHNKMSSKPIAVDGFENLLTGLGTSKDSLTYMNFKRGKSISLNREFVSALYSENWLASAVVDVTANDMTRNWISILDEEESTEDIINKELKRLKAKSKVNQALKWAGAYGGAIIIMMVDDGKDLKEPLLVESVRKQGIKNLLVLDRWHVNVSTLNTNLLSTNYGLPEYYMVSRNGQQIHHSRVLRFDGEIKSIEEFERQGYWGNSIYEKTWQPISNSQGTSLEIAAMVKESNVDVYGIDQLNEMIAMGPEGEAAAVKRLSVAHQMKSYINGIALDKNDTYEKKSNTFAGLPDLDDKFLLKVSGASRIPPSKLLGKQEAGLGDTGQSSLTNYYDDMSARQENEMTDPLQKLLDIIYVSKVGKVKTVDFEYEPLWQMTQEQESTISLNNAQRDQIYLDKGVISIETTQKQLSSDQVYGAIDEDINDQNNLFDDIDENEEDGL